MRSRECRAGSGAAVGLLLVALALSFLVGCGGDNGSPAPLIPPPGSEAPIETGGEQSARIAEILSRTDSLLATHLHGEQQELPPDPGPGIPPLPDPLDQDSQEELEFTRFAVELECEGTVCRAGSGAPRSAGIPDRVGVSILGWVTRETEARLSRHGITLLEGQAEVSEPTPDTPAYRNYGAWMEHSGFVFRRGRSLDEDYETTWRYGVAGGDLSGTRPVAVSGMEFVWKGVMVGSVGRDPVPLQGDATLIYSAANGTLRAEFSDIYELEEGGPHEIPYLRFDGVPVSVDGTFGAGAGNNRIAGGFYGPDHAESVGTFEQLGVFGAFGARRRNDE